MRKVALLVASGLMVAGATAFYLEEQSARDAARLFDQVLTQIEDRYVDSLGTSALFEKAARGLVEQLNDPYSELFSPQETKQFTTATGGRYGGVGMLIEDQQGAIVVSRVYPHTPAEAAGMRQGDRILEVDGQSTRGWKTSQVSEKMMGDPGSKVRARFGRPGVATPIDITFTRATIRIPAVPYAIMIDTSVAYLPLQTFNETAAREVADELSRLQREGAKSLVLDLRGNAGGYLPQALAIANLFIKRGQEIVSVRSRGGTTETAFATFDPIAPAMPIVILTDGYSASASEIVAGALQDHDRALIVGTTSFGKGLVQTMYDLDGGWSLKITTGKWYTPSGRSIHKPRTVTELEQADTTAAADDIANRPVFKSDGGRTVYGGGAITPDVIVKPDTISSAERALAQRLIAKQQEVYVLIYDYALSLKDGVKPFFAIQPAWRETLYNRVREKGVDVSKAEWDAGHEYADRLLQHQIARLAFGDSTAKRMELADDNQLTTALDMLRRGRTQQELFVVASALNSKPKQR